MPRPVPPSQLGVPDYRNFLARLDESCQSELARKLGVTSLSKEATQTLQDLIAVYRATMQVHIPTKGAVKSVIREMQRANRKFLIALRPVIDENSCGVDDETFDALNRLATKCVAALERFGLAASAQIERLSGRRVYPAAEHFSIFCGQLSLFFRRYTAPALVTSPQAAKHLRDFALEVLNACEIEHSDYVTHPERLDEMLRTDVLPKAYLFSTEGTVKGSFGGVRF
jgi:hypothetical protein